MEKKGKVKCLKQLHENAVRMILKKGKKDEAGIKTACEQIAIGMKELKGVNYNLEAQRL
jgi:hypothetical protein